ncbi:hypothetical protein POJ06DRAFT_267828 [Lipomyces tetrasporus]|uniref:Uncharacterized protein n=1 Tax=Lipomyces tetrasporus TaxID=54092 RepID=A0AAD7QS23_9ASCO|nr:uncharacterized protein POJ06DRAFT_267828 [Lipomyces tetrasporus]KAJ8100231.1 hypothetical protein POJ06DRAFT_267828 [Lipomyces tetrasporus]
MSSTVIDDALKFIAEGAGKRFIGRATPRQFDQLCAIVGDDKRYSSSWPRLQYHAPDQEVVIDNFPVSGIHQVLSSFFLNQIEESFPLSIQSRFTVVFSTGHTRSDTGAAIIIEVGFSESMRRLERDAETWLIGLRDEVRVCIIITLDEQPAYRIPASGIVGPGIDIDEEAAAARVAMTRDRIDAGNVGMPLRYRGQTWVNWLTGRWPYIKQDLISVDLPLELTDEVTGSTPIGLRRSCFLSIEDMSMAEIEDIEVPFNFSSLYQKLRIAIAELGHLRYKEYLKTRASEP